MPAPHILAFAGSARRESLNKKLLANVVEFTRAAGAEVTVVDFKDLPIPLYEGDLEDAEGMPPNAQKLIDLITQHQGLLISTPEYNSQMPPVLKNAIDWCTRADDNPLKGKVAAVVSASPGAFGAIRSMTLLRALLVHLGCHVVPAQCILPAADKAFDEQGKLKEERTRKAAQGVANELVRVTKALSGMA
ncbi:MAG TPA: NAD(P)H-dependent oxidoreductase [Opitutaceae bacterium]|nr:NAD(P)H-dependent oxidoreductase [Opitutaceae bacterium]